MVAALAAVAVLAGCGGGSGRAAPPTPTTAAVRTGVPPTAAPTTPVPGTQATTTAPTAASPAPTSSSGTCPAALELTTRQKVGQAVMAELTFSTAGEGVDLVGREQVGGIVFLGTPDASLGPDMARIRAAAGRIGPLLATDEEGGRVQRLSSVLGPLPSAREMAATLSPEQVTDLARDHAQAMKALGLDVDLAPVVDINETPTDGGVIGDRSFGTDPGVASAYGVAFDRGLQQAGVLGTVKHFPGHGRASGDSHQGSVTTPPLDQLRQADLVPFEFAIRAGAPAIMVGHLIVPGLTDGLPASLSPAAIDGLLRHDLGYDGLVITDSLEMGAITSTGLTPVQVVEKTLTAGSDIAMLPGGIDVGALLDQLTADAGTDRLPMADLDRAVRHVAAAKLRVGDWPAGPCT